MDTILPSGTELLYLLIFVKVISVPHQALTQGYQALTRFLLAWAKRAYLYPSNKEANEHAGGASVGASTCPASVNAGACNGNALILMQRSCAFLMVRYTGRLPHTTGNLGQANRPH